MPRTFIPGDFVKNDCEECGWPKDQHSTWEGRGFVIPMSCPSHLTCGHWTNENCHCGEKTTPTTF